MGGPGESKGPLIGPNTTVREAVTRYPGIETVFDRYGLGGCGGPDGPVEPIGFFARIHQVDPPQLLRELNAYAAGTAPAAPVPLLEKRPDRRTDLYILGVAAATLLALLAGFPFGILAALEPSRSIGLGLRWVALIQAHGHLQVMGWVGLFVVGVSFQVLPRFKHTELRFRRLAATAIGLIAGGLALRTATQPYSETGWVADLMVLSAALELVGAAAFVTVITGTLWRTARKNYDWYILAACAWMAASAIANLVLVYEIAADGQRVIPPMKDDALLTMQLWGFLALFIFGISIRVLPHFLSLRAPAVPWFVPALLVFNAALMVRVASAWVDAYTGWARPEELQTAAVWVMAAGVILFALALKVHLPAAPDDDAERERGHVKIIRTAYVWLAVTLVIEVWFTTRAMGSWNPDFLQAGAWRHALGLGFASTMMLGVGGRALPVFAGRTLHSRLLHDITFWLFSVAVFTRVGSGMVNLGSASSRFDHIGGSGALAYIAVVLFAYNIGRSVLGRPKLGPAPGTEIKMKTDTPGPPTFSPGAGTVVADVLANIPGSLELLIGYGFKPLADPEMRAKLTPHVTLGTACKMHGIELETLLGDLTALQQGGTPTPASQSEQQRILNALRDCHDPEIPVNIVDLGLVYEVAVTEGRAKVRMTLTAPDCPAAGEIMGDVSERIRALGYEDVEVELVREPPWEPSRMSPAARIALNWQ